MTRFSKAKIGIFALAWIGCSHGTPPTDARGGGIAVNAAQEQCTQNLNSALSAAHSDTQAMEVFYVTNRKVTDAGPGCGDSFFGTTPAKDIFYGSCKINAPKKHSIGTIEPADNPRADTHRYFRFLGHTAYTADSLKDAIIRKGGASALVFVHGFNVKFEEALFRAAQIAYDLKQTGPIILLSWPAGSGRGFLDSTLINRTYAANTENAAGSIEMASDFFKLLATTGVPVHLMVHSMGHQVVLPALAKSAIEIGRPFIRELVLNAPDFPVAEFSRVINPVRTLAHRVTLYCSYNDNAIAASEIVNRGRRMGGCEIFEGVDVINVADIDVPTLGVGGLGHGYYASRPILTDVFQVLLGVDAERRLFVRKSEPNSTENFYLRP